MSTPPVRLVHVFAAAAGGGNPAPIVIDAARMSDDAMREVARAYGHEGGFVLPPSGRGDADLSLRFWTPAEEVPMCGHATIGAVWLLQRMGLLSKRHIRIETASGIVEANVSGSQTEDVVVEVSQPRGSVERLADGALRERLAAVLGTTSQTLGEAPIQNASTSRVKTLIPIRSIEALDSLTPDYARVRELCEDLGSTGLYPYATGAERTTVDARQFPRSSGYPEDAATGIAAAALAFGLVDLGVVPERPAALRVRQGRSMGRPSEIVVRLDGGSAEAGCWIGGRVRMEEPT
jgi:PhzF family phenazine biosynthesis protein